MSRDNNEYLERWKVTTARGDGAVQDDLDHLNELLADGWEPFAATSFHSVSGFRIHLRKFYFTETEPENAV